MPLSFVFGLNSGSFLLSFEPSSLSLKLKLSLPFSFSGGLLPVFLVLLPFPLLFGCDLLSLFLSVLSFLFLVLSFLFLSR